MLLLPLGLDFHFDHHHDAGWVEAHSRIIIGKENVAFFVGL